MSPYERHGYQVTLSGLLRKRAELAGRAETLNDQLRQLLSDLEHLDSTIRMFDPLADPGEVLPRRPPALHATTHKGQTTRALLELMRDGETLTAYAMAERIICDRGLSVDDKRLVQTMRTRVGAALRKLRDRGAVASVDGGQGMLVWRLA